MDYVKQYNSKKVLLKLIDTCSHQAHYLSLFSKRGIIDQLEMVEVLNLLIPINREQKFLKELRLPEIITLSNFSGIILKISRIKDEYKKIFEFLVVNYDKLPIEQKAYYFELEEEGAIEKNKCWSYAYPYFTDISYKMNKKLFDKLVARIEKSNFSYDEKIIKIKEEGRNEYNWIDNQTRHINEKYEKVYILQDTVLKAIDNEEYELAHRLNNLCKNKISEDVFEHAEVRKNKKLTAQEKEILYCIHEGIVNLDELIAIDNFKVYEETIKKYPASKAELIYNKLFEKDYKWLFDYFSNIEKNENVVNCFRTKDLEALSKSIEQHLRQNAKFIINQKYFEAPKDNFGRIIVKTQNMTYPFLISCKNKIFLNDLLQNNIDLRLYKKALETASQQEKDNALENIIKNRPTEYSIQKVILETGAKLHKRWTEDDGWGYMVDNDLVDEVSTELLKNQIKILMNKEVD